MKITEKMVVNAVLGIISAVMLAAIIYAIMWTSRLFSNSVTMVTVEEVAPGVRCAKMVTADGAAISCWKENDGHE